MLRLSIAYLLEDQWKKTGIKSLVSASAVFFRTRTKKRTRNSSQNLNLNHNLNHNLYGAHHWTSFRI
jgi:hypothetical protein